MRICLLQLDGSLDTPLAERVDAVVGLVAAQQADLVVLPELWAHGAWDVRSWESTAEELPGSVVPRLAEAARAATAYVHCGSFVERDTDGTLYNTSVVLDPAGGTVGTYRKVHRFGFDTGEAALLGAGTGPVVVEIDGTVFGLATCYDLRFPELFRGLVDLGAEAVLVTSSWPEARIAHWSVLARARAIENQVWVLACNQAGAQNRVALGGRSVIIDPMGKVLVEVGEEPGPVCSEVDLGLVPSTRAAFPVLRDRRL